MRPGKDVNQPRAENDDTLEISNVDSPRRDEVNWINGPVSICYNIFLFQSCNDEHGQERVNSLPEDAEEEANEVEEVSDVEAEERPKAVRRLSFSNSPEANEPKKLKTSIGTANGERKMLKKKPVSKTRKASLVFPVSRVHNRLKEDRYATRVRFCM